MELGDAADNIFLLQRCRSYGAFLVPTLHHPLQRHAAGLPLTMRRTIFLLQRCRSYGAFLVPTLRVGMQNGRLT